MRDLSTEQIHEIYRQTADQFLDRVAETEPFFRATIVAINILEADPLTGDRTSHKDEIVETKENFEGISVDSFRVSLYRL